MIEELLTQRRLFSERAKSQFKNEITHRRTPDPSAMKLDLEKVSFELSGLPVVAPTVTIRIPFLGNPQWFSVYDDEKPFSSFWNDDIPIYSIINPTPRQRSLEVIIRLKPGHAESSTQISKLANECINAIDGYIRLLCPPGLSVEEIAKLLAAHKAPRPG